MIQRIYLRQYSKQFIKLNAENNYQVQQKRGMINGEENDCFTLIWYYWYKKYIEKKSKRKSSSNELASLKKQYSIQAIQSQNNPHLLSQKLSFITQKTKSSKSSSTVYTINPETEAKEIEELFIKQEQKQKTKQLINQLYSYYLNSKNVFVIYKGNIQNSTLEQFSKIITEDDSLERNQSLMESYETDNKIDGLQVGDMLSEFDGIQLWNAKYRNIPHTFIKVKKYSWTKALNKPLSHPSQPKTVNNLPILPRIGKYKPSIDKLKPFISYIKMLEEYFPDNYPTIDSIYEYNNMPYIFVQEGGWQTNIGVLCYFIVFGDPEANINKNIVDRWVENNPSTLLANTIVQMTQRQNNKTKYGKQGISKGLGLLTGQDSDGNQIW